VITSIINTNQLRTKVSFRKKEYNILAIQLLHLWQINQSLNLPKHLGLANCKENFIDGKGEFFKVKFSDEEDLCLQIPQDFGNHYEKDEQTIYGLIQTVLAL
jgi:hypothetical protein